MNTFLKDCSNNYKQLLEEEKAEEQKTRINLIKIIRNNSIPQHMEECYFQLLVFNLNEIKEAWNSFRCFYFLFN